MTTFSVIGTPIGNLEDITLRALSVLKKADLILCEDTRVTRKLLDHYAISVPTESYHVHSGPIRKVEILEYIKAGKNIALVSDAGTPGISDPGAELVGFIRQELKAQIADGSLKLESIPGPSALTTAIAVAGVPRSDFVFLGFLPHKKGRETLFREMATSARTVIFYESPHRIIKTFESLVQHCGSSVYIKLQKRITVCRELTKMFEEVISGTAEEVREYFEKNNDKVRGEFVVLVSRFDKGSVEMKTVRI